MGWDYIAGIYTVIRAVNQARPIGFPSLDTLVEDAIKNGQKQLIIITRGYDGWSNITQMVKWLSKWQSRIKIYVMVYQKTPGPGAIGGHPFAATHMSDSEPL